MAVQRLPGYHLPMKTQYFAATSLDGFLATEDDSWTGCSRWATCRPRAPEFIAGVGALAMGSATYEWMLRHADAVARGNRGGVAYTQPAWVFSSRTLPGIPGADIRFVSGDVRAVHAQMQAAAGGAISGSWGRRPGGAVLRRGPAGRDDPERGLGHGAEQAAVSAPGAASGAAFVIRAADWREAWRCCNTRCARARPDGLPDSVCAPFTAPRRRHARNVFIGDEAAAAVHEGFHHMAGLLFAGPGQAQFHGAVVAVQVQVDDLLAVQRMGVARAHVDQGSPRRWRPGSAPRRGWRCGPRSGARRRLRGTAT